MKEAASKQIESILKDYHWMMNSIKILRDSMKDAGEGLTAQYGIEATLPKPQGYTDVIMELINSHNTQTMVQGEKYYYNDSDIKKRKFHYWKDGIKQIDEDKTNHRIPHGWHKLLVDQKAAYLVGKPVTFNVPDETYLEKLSEILADEFDDVMPELVIAASNKGREWLHPFINEEQIPAEEGIPIYGGAKRKNIESFIRFYHLDEGTIKVEVWDKQQAIYYEKTDHGHLVFDVTEEINPAPHFTYGDKGYGWGEVPFIDFKNQ
ncbi:phage portal protein [Peribacillus sp. NPDC096379]|uniref:phage portal protein n=1 Tax=Peribacillus sp. NPDC096379 TaxID=3364393 RepID=UPI003825059B